MHLDLGLTDFPLREYDGRIVLDAARADRHARKLCAQIWNCDSPDEVRALYASDPELIAALEAQFPEQHARVMHEFSLWLPVNPATSAPGGNPAMATEWQTKGPTMANPDFLKHVVRGVTFKWPRLDQPYRYDQNEKRTEACAPGAPNASYSIAWEMSGGDAKALYEKARAHYADCKTRNAKLPEFSTVFGWKKPEEKGGMHTFVAKKRAMNNDGVPNKPPKVVGPDLQPITGEDLRIWSGSEGSVRVLMFPATDPQTGKGGITLMLDTVQVVTPVYGGDNLEDDFGPAQAKSLDDDDFGAPAPAAPPKAPPQPAAAAAFDDDLGF